MKVLFLDIDGVLNSTQGLCWHKRTKKIKGSVFMDERFFCPMAMNNFRYLFANLPHLNIVISSTWRKHYTLDELKDIFVAEGIKKDLIIGTTPVMHTERGLEIQAWLDDHPTVTKFCILDDSTDMAHLAPFHVKTNPDHGFMWQDLKDVLKMLGSRAKLAEF